MDDSVISSSCENVLVFGCIFYVKGPLFNNYLTATAPITYSVVTLLQMVYLLRILRSEQLVQMLAKVHQLETGHELANRLCAHTKVGVGRIVRAALFFGFQGFGNPTKA